MREYILIDDDELLHIMWKQQAVVEQVKLECFVNPNHFVKTSESFNKQSIVLIDSNLDDGIKGEEFAEIIYNLGFETIYLLSAYTELKIEDFSYLKGIIGKKASFKKLI